MGAIDKTSESIGCLSLAFPQFVAKELAYLVDQIMTEVTAATDPLARIGNRNITDIIDGLAEVSSGAGWDDITDNAGDAIAGLSLEVARRNADNMYEIASSVAPNTTKRIADLLNAGEKVATSGMLFLSLVSDSPYIVAQLLCETITDLVELKIANLGCLRTHITQLTNAMVMMAENAESYSDDMMVDLDAITAKLQIAEQALRKSRVTTAAGDSVFDALAFTKARSAVEEALRIMAPKHDGYSIMGVSEVLIFGSADQALLTKSNVKLSTLVIAPLIQMIRAEMAAIDSQTDAINYHLAALKSVIANFRTSKSASRVKEIRARLIKEILERTTDLKTRVVAARKRGSTRAASGEMLLWTGRTKAILAMMHEVTRLSLKEGSLEGPDRAVFLQTQYSELLVSISAINSTTYVAGHENLKDIRAKTMALAVGVDRSVGLFDRKSPTAKKITKNEMIKLQVLAAQTATKSGSLIVKSIDDAVRLKSACQDFINIPIKARGRYDKMLNTMSELGFDRAKDLLSTGEFGTFLSIAPYGLTYLGTIIKCLNEAMDGVDDESSKKELAKIRDKLIGQQTNQSLATITKSGAGSRLIDQLQTKIGEIQKSARTVEMIYLQLKKAKEAIGVDVDALEEGLKGLGELRSNTDHLTVGAGGRLSAGLKEFSKNPNYGSPLC